MKQIALLLVFACSLASAQTIYLDSGDIYTLKEGEKVFITDQEWVFTVEKGGYMRGLFEFYRILPLCEYAGEGDLGFGHSLAKQCKSVEEQEEQNCDGFTFGGGDDC